MSFIKPIVTAIAMTFVVGAAAPTMASAQDRHNDRRIEQRHENRVERRIERRVERRDRREDRAERRAERRWERGQRLPSNYRGRVVSNYRNYGLQQPPRGHRWVQVDGTYVLIAAATGIIANIIISN